MSTVFPNSNLPEPSQQWGKEVQKRVETLQSDLIRQKVNSDSVDSQLQSSYKRIDETLNGLFGLGNAGSPYQINADNINAGNINGNVVSVTNLNAGNITSGTIASGRITSDSISAANISAGQITSGTISSARIDSASISAANISAGQIASGTISADRIATSSLTSANLNADNINAGSISGDRISAGTITGSTIRTAASGKRVTLNNSLNAVQFHNGVGALCGQIDGLGTSSASANLEISGPGAAGLTVNSSSVSFSGLVVSSGTSANIVAGQRLGQGTFSSTGGTVTAVGRAASGDNFGLFGPASSDIRLKKDITELQSSLELINNLRPVKFRFKSEEDGPVSYGLIAQEVQPFFDENDNVVNSFPGAEGEESYLSIEYNAFIAPLIGAVKELTQKNLDLEARIAILESKV